MQYSFNKNTYGARRERADRAAARDIQMAYILNVDIQKNVNIERNLSGVVDIRRVDPGCHAYLGASTRFHVSLHATE